MATSPSPDQAGASQPREQLREQSTDNKQGRQEGGDIYDRVNEVGFYRYRCMEAFQEYRRLLARGWPRELARAVLPVSTYSHMFAKVDLKNLLGFLDLRTGPHAQYEIRVYAEALRLLAWEIAPVCMEAWETSRA